MGVVLIIVAFVVAWYLQYFIDDSTEDETNGHIEKITTFKYPTEGENNGNVKKIISREFISSTSIITITGPVGRFDCVQADPSIDEAQRNARKYKQTPETESIASYIRKRGEIKDPPPDLLGSPCPDPRPKTPPFLSAKLQIPIDSWYEAKRA